MKTITITSIVLTYFLFISAFYIHYYNDNLFTENYDEEQERIYDDLRMFWDSDYFGYDRVRLIESFEPDEQRHHTDVKRILDWVNILYYIAALFLALSFFYIVRNELDLSKVFRYSGFASFFFVVVIGILTIINFDFFWSLFHEILFPQGNWQFSPNSLSITLFPTSLFEELTIRIVGTIMLFATIVLVIGYKNKK